MSELYIGLMSGTSIDGIDASLVDFSTPIPSLVEYEYLPFTADIRNKIQRLSLAETPQLLTEYGAIDSLLGHLFAEATNRLLRKTDFSYKDIHAIGSHGQTVYHSPTSDLPFSLQIGDPNIIAEKTKITTVADFRRRDIAAGGQGAPLVPAFHLAIFGELNKKITVVNIGGIANITVFSEPKIIAFDTGPGNTLIDYWSHKHLQQTHDHQGQWAKSGQLIPELLVLFKQANYFKLPPPKSTGKEYFSSTWLTHQLANFSNANPQDIQATLCHLTANTIIDAIHCYAPATEELIICGGGVHNLYLIELLRAEYQVNSSANYGIDPDYMEAMAFAWLARQTLNYLSGNIPAVTGAKHHAILGGIYAAPKNFSGTF